MFDPKRYPPNWNEITASIRARAKNKCETCGAPNGATIIRSAIDPARYIMLDEQFVYRTPQGEAIRLSEIPSEYEGKHVKVILTVHHIGVTKPDGTPGDPHDKMDCREENLTALCQRCHLLADLPIHMANAARTRYEKKYQNQMRLL